MKYKRKKNKLVLNRKELLAVIHFIGKTSQLDRTEMGLSEEQSELLSRIYDYVQPRIKSYWEENDG